MFYTYVQNNSGGKFITDNHVGEFVIIEASSYKEANTLAESHGVYFNGCNNDIDCYCCGDRWNESYDGSEEPMIYGRTIEEFKKDPGMLFGRVMTTHIYYLNDEHERIVFNTVKAVEKKKAEERKKARKLWGNFFSLTDGVRNKNPIRFYEHKYNNFETGFYDKNGDIYIEEGLKINNGYVSFASENKTEVIEFMSGAKYVMDVAKSAVLGISVKDNTSTRYKGIAAAAKLFSLIKN